MDKNKFCNEVNFINIFDAMAFGQMSFYQVPINQKHKMIKRLFVQNKLNLLLKFLVLYIYVYKAQEYK